MLHYFCFLENWLIRHKLVYASCKKPYFLEDPVIISWIFIISKIKKNIIGAPSKCNLGLKESIFTKKWKLVAKKCRQRIYNSELLFINKMIFCVETRDNLSWFEGHASTSSWRSLAKTPSVSQSFLSSKYSLGFILSTNGILIKSPESRPPRPAIAVVIRSPYSWWIAISCPDVLKNVSISSNLAKSLLTNLHCDIR